MILLLLLSFAASAGAPWVRAAGESYTKLGWSWFTADSFVAPGGVVIEDTRYDGHTGSLYGELGLGADLHAVVFLPFVGSRNTLDDVAYINRGFGDAQVGLVAGHSVGPVPVSLTVRGKLPLYDNGVLLQYGAAGQGFPALGDGQVDLDAVASVGSGISLGPVRGWAMGELGYRHRTEWWLGDRSRPDRELADGLLWTVQLGWSPILGTWEAGWLFVQADGVTAFTDDQLTRRLAQVGGGLGLRVWEGLAVELGVSRVVWAEAAAPGRSLSAGASWTR